MTSRALCIVRSVPDKAWKYISGTSQQQQQQQAIYDRYGSSFIGFTHGVPGLPAHQFAVQRFSLAGHSHAVRATAPLSVCTMQCAGDELDVKFRPRCCPARSWRLENRRAKRVRQHDTTLQNVTLHPLLPLGLFFLIYPACGCTPLFCLVAHALCRAGVQAFAGGVSPAARGRSSRRGETRSDNARTSDWCTLNCCCHKKVSSSACLVCRIDHGQPISSGVVWTDSVICECHRSAVDYFITCTFLLVRRLTSRVQAHLAFTLRGRVVLGSVHCITFGPSHARVHISSHA